ncbi:MAG: Fibronectin type III protein [uncultured bacterium]|nr:MAG: Fibronectin type III protein [uncultured bacterium]
MFDDQISKSNPPSNLPTEPADMFAGVEKDESSLDVPPKTPDALGAGLLKKKDYSAPSITTAPMSAPSLYEVKQPILGKILMFVIVAVLLGAIGFGGWYAYDKFIKNNVVDNNIPSTEEQTQPVVETPELPVVEKVVPFVPTSTFTPTSSDVTTKMNNDKILFGEAVDSDKDGLDDVRERELGTDPFNADTDKDGLSDGDEVIIWKTNPINPDTDSDTYKDGEEVRNGYNPLGAGKLFNVPAGASTSTLSSTSSKTTVDTKNKK